MSNEGYWALSLVGSTEAFERALTSLFEAGCLGTAELDGGPPVAYFSRRADPDAIVRLVLREPGLEVKALDSLPERDWLALWRRDFKGLPIGERFYVQPSWEAPYQGSRIVLRIDPERAFGTGTHETTRLSVSLLELYLEPGLSVLDAGSGTGILAMAAAHLGATAVLAVEADPDAARCASANVALNQVGDRVTVVRGSFEDARFEAHDLVVANLSADLLAGSFSRLSELVAPNGILILGGILIEQEEDVQGAAPESVSLIETREDGGWVSLVYRKSTCENDAS